MLLNIFLLGITLLLWDKFDLESTGIAFVIGHIVLVCIIFLISNQSFGFDWTLRNKKIILKHINQKKSHII